ncbi:uncharacterized protein LY79DRAFT_584190 [Colletotrichum navitas]|uniref:Uncharacterized protein n=1 Tax=Colletotrichum navitas TaxID=681940 RepID=A0AAD8PM89_9PEZI|nr:uncharacterized protein LY79DRAFT_584190 [Colletotrichum navitas]KAK1570201.1 hypothetical protein LY79DRAFT_584190 [Colletotrichum navitas]
MRHVLAPNTRVHLCDPATPPEPSSSWPSAPPQSTFHVRESSTKARRRGNMTDWHLRSRQLMRFVAAKDPPQPNAKDYITDEHKQRARFLEPQYDPNNQANGDDAEDEEKWPPGWEKPDGKSIKAFLACQPWKKATESMGPQAKKDHQSNESQQANWRKLEKSPRVDERHDHDQQVTGEIENGGQQATAGEDHAETQRDEGREKSAQSGGSGLSLMEMGGLASSLPSVPQTEPVSVSTDHHHVASQLTASRNPPPVQQQQQQQQQQERDGPAAASPSHHREDSSSRNRGGDAGSRQARARDMPTEATIGISRFSPQDYQLFRDWVAREERKKAREADGTVRGSPRR